MFIKVKKYIKLEVVQVGIFSGKLYTSIYCNFI